MTKANFKLVMTGAVGALLALLFNLFFRITFIQGYSMEDTFENKQVCVSTPVYSELSVGDVVVAQSEVLGQVIIKRIIACPGDIIEIRDNVVYVNGEVLPEPYLKESMVTANIYIKLANDEYFLCGDNRNNSLDSRTEFVGPIKEEEILYRVLTK